MTHFWAKTTLDGKPGISVYDHMVDVGCVAQCLTEIAPQLLVRFGLLADEVGALAALHDLGKISPGFQQKCQAWLEENGLVTVARNGCWDTGMEGDHGRVSHAAIQDFLMEEGMRRKTAKFISTVLAAHHGKIKYPPNDRGIRSPSIAPISEERSAIDWSAERKACAKAIWNQFSGCRSTLAIDEVSPALWWLAGLTTVADWIGSNEAFFPASREPRNEAVVQLAQQALDAIGFRKSEFRPGLSFHDLFHDTSDVEWHPNDMQQKTYTTVTGPGVYVIEAPMGIGKTEAALWAAYRLLLSGKATGIYFALPTQVTSNRIHLRLSEFVKRIVSGGDRTHLIHANSWLLDSEFTLSPSTTDAKTGGSDDARKGRDWFASTKRALLAPFGVGTVDQALLGVVAAKHFFVRHFALAGKVVILDEVHSYDLYTGTLIDKLIATLEGLGCTVIVLSATLTRKRLEQIVLLGDGQGMGTLPYPLITGRKEGEPIHPVAATEPEPHTIVIDFLAREKASREAVNVAKRGGAVLWICNTVDAAQQQYRHLMEQVGEAFPVGLLHSRFPFWQREQLESHWMELFGKNGDKRCGAILVATQIVEQSVDLDADLMVTELAPTDMLFQRLGRLWRHQRENRPVDLPRLYILEEEISLDEFRHMESKAIIKSLGAKANIYAPYVLLRSLEVWKGQDKVLLPSQIRLLLELTYQERGEEPASWQALVSEWKGSDSAKKTLAMWSCNLWQPALKDEEGVQTRLNEMPTVALVLCRSIDNQEAVFVDGASEPFSEEQFRLSLAQAIHKNLVRVPEYCFDKEKIMPCSAFSDYLHGVQSVGIISESGSVRVAGLQDDFQFFYSDELGLVINRNH